MNTFLKKADRGAIIVSLVLALIMTVTPMFTAGTRFVFGDTGDVEWLRDLKVKINDWQEGDPLKHDEKISIEVSFGVPVLGDPGAEDSGKYFEHGDTVTILLSEYFQFVDLADPPTIDLYHNGRKVGTATLSNNEDNQAQAEITFDGDAEIFAGGWTGVSLEFGANLLYNETELGGDEDELLPGFLIKDVEFLMPGDSVTESIAKEGILNDDKGVRTKSWTS